MNQSSEVHPPHNAPLPRRTGRTTATYIVLALAQRGLPYLLLPFVTAVMGPAEYGAVSVVTMGSLLVGVVLGGALEEAVFRWGARRREQSREILMASVVHLTLVLPAIAATTALVFAVLDFELLEVSSRIWAISILAAGIAPIATSLVLPLARARDDIKSFIIVSAISIGVSAISRMVFVLLLQWGVWGWVLSDLATALAGLFGLLSVRMREFVMIPSRSSIRTLMRFALPLVPHRVAFWALGSLTRPLMAVFVSLQVVGVFALGLNIATLSTLILAEINRGFLLNYSREMVPAPTILTRDLAQTQFVLAFAVPVLIVSSYALMQPLVIGGGYEGSVLIAAGLSLGQIAYGVYLVPMNYIVQTKGVTGLSWIASAVGAVFIFVAVLLGSPAFGVWASVLATVVGYVAMSAIAFAIASILKIVRWRLLVPDVLQFAIAVAASAVTTVALLVTTEGTIRVVLLVIAIFGSAVAILIQLRRSAPRWKAVV